MRCVYVIGLCMPMFLAIGCAHQPQGFNSTPQVVDVEYRDFVSPDAMRLKGKIVRVRAVFFAATPGEIPRGYSKQDFMAFETVAPSGATLSDRPGSPSVLTVLSPHALDHIVLTLKPGDPLVIQGPAIPTDIVSANGTRSTQLVVQADSIEKKNQ